MDILVIGKQGSKGAYFTKYMDRELYYSVLLRLLRLIFFKWRNLSLFCICLN